MTTTTNTTNTTTAAAANAALAANASTATSTSNDTLPSSMASESSQQLSNQFLTLLVAQMKNQDPLNPTNNSQVTSQIAQINTVTGINNLNSQLSQITGQIKTSQQLQASSLIGKNVLVPGDQVKVGSDGTATDFGMDLPSAASDVKITITDDAGNVVHQSEYKNQSAGVQSFTWDGKNASGVVVDPGSYTVNISAVDANGNPVQAQTLDTGYVNGVVSSGSGSNPQLDLGPDGLVDLSNVYQIL